MLVEGKGNGREKARWRGEGQHGVPKNKRQRGGKLWIQTAVFCLFMFISLFYRRRYCFSGATESQRGCVGGWKVRLCLCGNYGSFVIPPVFFSVREPLLSFFLLFHRLTRAAVFPFPSFFSHVSPFFFTLLYSWNARRASWQLTAAAEFDRSFMDLGRSYRLLSVKRFAIIRCNCDRFSLVQWDRFLEPLQARSFRCLLCFCTNHDGLLPIGLLR